MNILKKIAATAAAAALLAGVGVAAASPAAADSFLHPDKVWSISDPKTARSVDTHLGTVQVRYGTYQGRQYGWGRIMNGNGGDRLLFEIDTDGDRVPDTSSLLNITGPSVGWTYGYPTSSSSDRAFRACILDTARSCAFNLQSTDWW